MPYVFLAGACICFSLQFIFTKLFQNRAGGTIAAGTWNSILSGVAMFAIFFVMNGFAISFSASSVLFGLVYSVSSIVCTVASVIGLSCAGVGLITFYTLLGGMVLPFAYGILFLGERPSVFRWIGAALLLAALVIPLVIPAASGSLVGQGASDAQSTSKTQDTSEAQGDSKAQGSRSNTPGSRSNTPGSVPRRPLKLILCSAAVFLSNGFVSISTTAAMRANDAVGERDFLLTATMIKIAICLALLAFTGIRRRALLPEDQKTGSAVSPTVFLLLFAICCGYAALNGAGNIFNLSCARTMDASLQYPVISAACIILSALFGLLFFKEKPRRGDVIGIAVSMAGIILFAF
ncbi:MAG: hypothetical protein ILO53_05485 [Clostridia bacterium]|nr:hypothetical protein [Clostridia bacterium]